MGLPLFIHDDFNILKYHTYRSIGIIPSPTNAHDGLIKYVYTHMNIVAEQFEAIFVVVILGLDATPVAVNTDLFPSNALVVNAHHALLKRLPIANNKHFMNKYAHWRGVPSRLVDVHPNEAAHTIIAQAIVSAIRKAEIN